MTTLRLLTYNVRSLRDDQDAVARVIRDSAPHVVCIQEAPRFARWRSRCAALARRSGMIYLGGGRPAGANVLMAGLGVDVLALRTELFTSDPGLHQRGAVLAHIALRGSEIVVAGTHLDLVEGPRLRHIAELERAVESLAGYSLASVIAGDVNDVPGSPTWRALTERRVDVFATAGDGDGFTYSATAPVRRIDGVFTDPRLFIRSAEVPAAPDVRIGSDHRPVLVELDL